MWARRLSSNRDSKDDLALSGLMERPREVEQPGPYDLPLPWGVRGRSRQKLLQVRQWALSATRQCKGTPSVTLGSLWRLTCVYRELIPSGFTVRVSLPY